VAAFPPVPATGSRLLDASAILRVSGGRPAVLQKLCEVFRGTVPRQMDRARSALHDRDLSRLREDAHRLYGTLAAFSTIAGALASTLEDSAVREDLESCTALVERLDGVCAELLEDTRTLTVDALRQ
jgi:two-component system sensor histidine kinase/response regulator